MNNSSPGHHRRILIVDDNRAIHGDFRKILVGTNHRLANHDDDKARLFGGLVPVDPGGVFELDSVYQGDDAVVMARGALAGNRPFALAFVDVRMAPGWDGVETVEKLWSVDPDLQVVLCAAALDYSWNETIERLGRSDRLVILKKPFDDVEVLQLASALTEKWRLGKLAAEFSARQTTLLDQATDAIWVSDPEGRVTYWNKGAERLLGWTAADALGQAIQELIGADYGTLEAANATLRDVGEWRGQLCHMTKAGREVTVESRMTLVGGEGGQSPAILAINTDITERRKLEAQYVRAQRIECVGTLAGGIAHDLNNILAPILMSVGVLQMTVRDDHGKRILATIEVSVKRGADMARQVLSFARGIDGDRIPTKPSHLIREISQIVEETFPKSIQYESGIAPDAWSIHGDPTQLHQVLLSLCVNARDAMPHGGKLKLSGRNFMLDEQRAALSEGQNAGPYVMFKVVDTGSGIPPEIIDKIFEPFFTTKEPGKGAGLGLSTVMSIVRDHGGFLNIRSVVGAGTTFEICFPAMIEAKPCNPEPRLGLPRGNGELILVVDDETSIRVIAQEVLEAFGYRVLQAANGVEALTIYAERGREIAVVAIDMMMPVMDGPTAIHALTKMNPKPRIIAVSGLQSNGALAMAESATCHFLSKPYTAGSLLTALHDVLSHT